MTHTFLMNFLIYRKLLQASQASIPQGLLHSLLYHSAVFICSACHLFPCACSFYVRNPRDSLPADQGSTNLRSHGTHGRLSDTETVNAGRNSCDIRSYMISCALKKCKVRQKIISIQHSKSEAQKQKKKNYLHNMQPANCSVFGGFDQKNRIQRNFLNIFGESCKRSLQ